MPLWLCRCTRKEPCKDPEGSISFVDYESFPLEVKERKGGGRKEGRKKVIRVGIICAFLCPMYKFLTSPSQK